MRTVPCGAGSALRADAAHNSSRTAARRTIFIRSSFRFWRSDAAIEPANGAAVDEAERGGVIAEAAEGEHRDEAVRVRPDGERRLERIVAAQFAVAHLLFHGIARRIERRRFVRCEIRRIASYVAPRPQEHDVV